ncbi:hypothetical protein [Pseudonocardia sp. GCM10023141]|uniref:hypothetical protein n=1 Tax=Pseudonocardia sp. GCM10023141 TaxID=3252653 RepID=UPI0036081873
MERHPQLRGDGPEPLLRAVVQIALDPGPLTVDGERDATAGPLQVDGIGGEADMRLPCQEQQPPAAAAPAPPRRGSRPPSALPRR